jgi:hypothetical protein
MHENESIAKKAGVLPRADNSRRQLGSFEFTVEDKLNLGVDLGFFQCFPRLLGKPNTCFQLSDAQQAADVAEIPLLSMRCAYSRMSDCIGRLELYRMPFGVD